MMTEMRKIMPTIMWIVIIAFVATIFFAWGMDYSSHQSEAIVAEIGKEKISVQDFDRILNIERERQREQQGGDLQPYQYRTITSQVLEQQIQRILMGRAFKSMELGASADEIFEDIKNNPPPEITQHPIFQTDSMFDTSKYIQFLNDPQQVQQLLPLEQHARDFRVPMNKMQGLMTAGIFVMNTEISREYRERTEKVVFEYAGTRYANYQVDTAKITNEMIVKYYQANQDSFFRAEQAELYFVQFSKRPTAQDEQNAINDLLESKSRIEEGIAQFEEEVMAISDDEGSAQQGGNLGTFKKGSMVPEFEAVAFSIQPGKLSEPFKSQFGYHVLIVDKRETVNGEVEVTARHILRKVQPSSETIDSIEAMVDAIRSEMEDVGFVAAAQKRQLMIDSTGLFTSQDYIKGLGYLYGAATFAFREKIGSISEKLHDENAYYVCGLKRRLKKGVMPLEDVRGDVVAALKSTLQKAMATESLQKQIASIAPTASVAALRMTDSLLIVSGTTDTLSRRGYIRGLQSNKLIFAAFATQLNARSSLIETREGVFVVRPLWVNRIDEIPQNTYELQNIKATLENARSQQIFGDWYLDYKRKSNVKEYLNQYYLN